MARDESAGKLHLTALISRLAFEALTGDKAASAAGATNRMESAVRCYLGDKGSDRPAWPYPAFLRGSETQGDVRVELELEEDLWRSFEEEAAAQGVTVEQLTEHAAFYFAAELEAGRLTQRIIDDLESARGDEET